MLSELQEKWLQALESGEYKQGFRKLRNSNGEFCCLGVACEVAGLKSEGDSYYYGSDFNDTILPGNFYKELGLKSEGGQLGESSEYLFTLNDERRMSFAEIAAFVRNNTELVFEEVK